MIRLMAAVRTTLVVAAWLGGVPTLLVAVAGSPIPPRPPSAAQFQQWLEDPLNPAYTQQTAEVLAWTVWGLITIAILAALALQLRTVRWAKVTGYLPPPAQSLAAAILGTAVVATSTSSLVTPSAAASATTTDLKDIDTQHIGLPAIGSSHAGPAVTGSAPGGRAAPPATAPSARHPGVSAPAWAPIAPAGHRLLPGDFVGSPPSRRLGDAYRTAGPRRAAGHLPGTTVAGLSTARCDAAPLVMPATPASAASLDGAPTEPSRFALAAHGGPLTVTAGGVQYTVIVQRGDTLWDLARAWLGDPHRWTEIYHRNADRYDSTGRRHHGGEGRMRGGDHIEATWQLILPDDATPPASVKPRTFIPPATTEPATAPADSTATSPPATAPAPTPSATTQPSAPAATGPTGDDGVAGDLPTPASPSATASPRAGGAATASPPANGTADPAAPRSGQSPPGVSLAGGSWVDLRLGLAIAAAATVVWRLRRRRYTPRPPSAHLRLDEPDLAPLPEVVTRVRRGLRTRSAPDTDGRPPDELVDDIDDSDDGFADVSDANVSDAGVADGADEPGQTDPPPLNLPAVGNPMLTAWPPAGLGLVGAGAVAAARGFLAAALAAGGVDDPDGCGNVVLPAATLATLLGVAAVHVPDTPRLTVTGDLSEALELMEEQTLHRTRLVYGHEVDTVAHLREADPSEEPLPPILLLADATVSYERARITALLAQGRRLDIHGVLLGEWPDGKTVVVAGDGTTTRGRGEGSRHGSHPADVGRLTVVTAAEAAALLPTLAESHTGLPQPAAPAQPQPRTPAATARPVTASDDLDQAANGADALPAADETGSPALDVETAGPSTPVQAGPGPDDEDGPDPDDGDAEDAADGPGIVAVQVLGRPSIVGADPQQPLRAKAMELLVYLIARDGGATIDAIIEDLVPDATLSKAPNRIHTYVYALRKALRRTGGPATYVTHPRHRYQLSRDTVEVDLWRLRAALAEAETTGGDARLAALRRAVACYRGPLAEGAHYEWAEPYREAVRRQAVDAHLALAEALRDQPERALAVLDAAIGHDPYAEQLYQAAMRRHADLDDTGAITARLAQLTHRLEELGAEPTDETTELAGVLTADVRRRARRNPGAAA